MKVCFFNITSMANNNNRINNHHQNRFGCAQTLFHFTVILFRVWIWMALSLFLSILTLLFGICVCASAHSICLTLYIKYSPWNNSRSRWIWIATRFCPNLAPKSQQIKIKMIFFEMPMHTCHYSFSQRCQRHFLFYLNYHWHTEMEENTLPTCLVVMLDSDFFCCAVVVHRKRRNETVCNS